MQSPIIAKLKALYNSLDELKSSGEDVVRDIKKEINNLELEYLKDVVFPTISQHIGESLSDLRCQIDMSFQFDGDKNIDYSYCTSNSGMLFRDKYKISKSSIKQDYSFMEDKNPVVNEPISINHQSKPVLYIEEYSEKSVVVYGDTKPYSEKFKASGGYFNPRLKVGPGWVFSKKREKELRSMIDFSNDKQKERPTLFDQSDNDIKAVKTVNYFIKCFDKMKNVTVNGHVGPHKAIFLLSLFEAIRLGIISDQHVYLTSKLLNIYDNYWKQYVPSGAPFQCNICQPFIHIASEEFFSLDLKTIITNINKSWTIPGVKAVCNYGVIDRELLSLARNESSRKEMSLFLIRKYCSPLRSITNSEPIKKSPTSRPVPINTMYSMADFRKYLSSIENHNGNPYSASSINVYCTAIRSDYLSSKAKIYEPDGIVLNIEDVNNVKKLLFDVENDFRNGFTSSSYVATMKLFLRFVEGDGIPFSEHRKILRKANESINVKTHIQKLRDSNRISICSVTTDDFTLSDGNPTEIFVAFVSKIGPELVSQMDINWLGYPLVSLEPHPKYGHSSKQLSGGYWLNTNSSTKVKIDQMYEIARQLNINIDINLA